MDILFGPDGIGGQPGLAGKAGEAIWHGTGELGSDAGLGETVAKSLGNIPHLLTDIAIKNPLEILKNPASVLNNQGQISFTRLLFPDFRRNVVKEEEQAAKARDAYTAAAALNTNKGVLKMIFDAAGAQGQGGIDQAVKMGVPQDFAQQYATMDQQNEDQTRGARDAVHAIDPTIPQVLLDTGITKPSKGLDTYLSIQRNKALDASRASGETRAEEAAGRAQTQFGERIPPRERRALAANDKYTSDKRQWDEHVLAAQNAAEKEAEKRWNAEQTNAAAATGRLEIAPFPDEVRAQAREQARAKYATAVPEPVPPAPPVTQTAPPQKPFGKRQAKAQTDADNPPRTLKDVRVRKMMVDDAKNLTKAGMEPTAAHYAAAFMRVIEAPKVARMALQKHENDTDETIRAKLLAGEHVLPGEGNKPTIMSLMLSAGYTPEELNRVAASLDEGQ